MKLGAGAFAEKTGLADDALNSYFKTVESGNATFIEYKTHVDATNQSIGAMGQVTKTSTAIFKGLKAVLGTMITTAAIALLMQGIDYVVNMIPTVKKIREEAEKAKNEINEITDNLKTQSQTVDEVKDRYAKLAQGVDQLTGKNLNLSESDYKEFLDISNKLAELFPTLSRNYDENGNAILDLKGNVDSIVGSLNNLIESQKKLANQKIMENMSDVFSGYMVDVEEKEKLVEKAEKQRDTIQEAYNSINNGTLKTTWYRGNQIDENAKILSNQMEYMEALRKLGVKFKESVLAMDGGELQTTITIDADNPKLEEMYNTKFLDAQRSVNYAKQDLQSQSSSINEYISSWLNEQFSYLQISDDGLKQAIQNLLFNFDWNTLPDNVDKKDWEQVSKYFTENILFAINEVQDNKEVSEALSKVFSGVAINPREKLKLLQQLQAYFNENGNEVNLIINPIIDDVNTFMNQYNKAINRFSKESSEEMESFFNAKGIDTSEEVDRFNELTEGATSLAEAIEMYNKATSSNNDDFEFLTDENKEDIDKYVTKIKELTTYLNKLDTLEGLSAEDKLELAKSYNIAAESDDEYKKKLKDEVQITEESSDIINVLKEQLEKCTSAKDRLVLSNIIDDLSKLDDETTKASKGFDNLANAMSSLKDRAELLRNINKTIEKYNKIDVSDLEKAVRLYPQLADKIAEYNQGLISAKELFSAMTSAYEMDQSNYATLMSNKLQYNETFYNQVVSDIPQWIKDLASSYDIDFDNFKNLCEAKLATQKEFALKSAKLAMANQILENSKDNNKFNDDQYKALKDMESNDFDVNENYSDARNKLGDILTIINAIDTSIDKTLGLKTGWKDYGLDSDEKEKEKEKSKTEIDWADNAISIANRKEENAKFNYENAGVDDKLNYLDTYKDSVTGKKTLYGRLSKEYKNRMKRSLKGIKNSKKIYNDIISGKRIDLKEYSSENGEKIKNAIDYYEKYKDANQTVKELAKQIDDLGDLEKSKLNQEQYTRELATIDEKLKNESLSLKEQKDLLDEKYKKQKAYNDELINQAKIEGDSEKENKINEENKNLLLSHNIEDSKLDQSEYQKQLDVIEEKLKSQSLTTKEKNELLDKEYDLRKKIYKETINQAKLQKDKDLEAKTKQEQKNDSLKTRLDKIKSRQDSNKDKLDLNNTLKENKSLSKKERDKLNEEIQKGTIKDYRIELEQAISAYKDTHYDEVLEVYNKLMPDGKKVKKVTANEISKLSDDDLMFFIDSINNDSMKNIFYKMINQKQQNSFDDFEAFKSDKQMSLDYWNNKIQDIKNNIEDKNGIGTKEQYSSMETYYKKNRDHLVELKKLAQENRSKFNYGEAGWIEWDNIVQQVQNDIHGCDNGIQECKKSILELPLKDVESKLEEIKQKLSDINESVKKENTFVTAAIAIFDKQIDTQNKLKEGIQDKIDLLQKERNLRKQNLDVQKAEWQLQKLKEQKSNLIFKGNGQGWQYEADSDAIRDATEALEEAKYNQNIANLQNQIDDIDLNIKLLERSKRNWEEINTEAERNANITSAIKYDSDFINKVLSGDLTLLQQVKSTLIETAKETRELTDLQSVYEEMERRINYVLFLHERNKLTDAEAEQQISQIVSSYNKTIDNLNISEEKKAEFKDMANDAVAKAKEASDETKSISEETAEAMKQNVDEITENVKQSTLIMSDYYKSFVAETSKEIDRLMSKIQELAASTASVVNAINTISSYKSSPTLSLGNVIGVGLGFGNASVFKANKHHSGVEKGVVGSASSNDADRVRLIALDKLDPTEVPAVLRKGEIVANEKQMTNIIDNFNTAANYSPIQAPMKNLSNSNVFDIGDIVINNPVSDANSLARDIKTNLGSALRQEMFK